MSKEEVLSELQKDIERNKNEKYGEYFYDDVKKRLKYLIISDKIGVIEVLRSWINMRHPQYTIVAAWLAGDFMITELKPDLEKLREDIRNGKSFKPYYVKFIDNSLKAIDKFT
jgi:hypothetical protein